MYLENNLTFIYRQWWDQFSALKKTLEKSETLGPELSRWLLDQKEELLALFPKHLNTLTDTDPKYLRNCIGKNNVTQEEGFLNYWQVQAQTSIHGHPSKIFYQVLSGSFEMEIYTRAEAGSGSLSLKTKRVLRQNDYIYFEGTEAQYDNFIHRVTCLEPGFTFHFYSEDARRGIIYDGLGT